MNVNQGQALLLLVDDAPASLRILEQILVDHYRLKLTTSATSAIRLASQRNDPPDLILLDLHMPGMDGIAVLARLRQDDQTQDIPVIMVTAETSDTLESEGIDLGADDYVTKPVIPHVLLARIRTILRRKAAESALRKSEEQFRTLFETMTQGVVYHDASGRIMQVNQAAMRILGLTAACAQATHPLIPQGRYIHRDGTPFTVEAHPTALALATGKPVKEVLMGVCRSETSRPVWLQVSAIPRFEHETEQPSGIFTTFTDVTAQVTLEQEQSMFMRMLNHEVRTPLAIIDSHCQLLSMEYPGETNTGRTVATMRVATTRVSELFDRCLMQDQMATMSRSNFAPVDLGALIALTAQDMQRGTNDHLLVIRIDHLPEHFSGDAALLRIMLSNLLDNAVRYSPEGGVIELMAQANAPGRVVIEVRDEGIGIPSSEQEAIFERYYRTHQVNDAVGVGLGLYIVRNIARLHRGDVTCMSVLGEGSVFRITLSY
ncbi:MAG: response regulator [Magnetococcales bacterium]|nr:response regulator [Magnetococcales bacterium]